MVGTEDVGVTMGIGQVLRQRSRLIDIVSATHDSATIVLRGMVIYRTTYTRPLVGSAIASCWNALRMSVPTQLCESCQVAPNAVGRKEQVARPTSDVKNIL